MELFDKIDYILNETSQTLYLIRFQNGEYIAKFMPALNTPMLTKKIETKYGLTLSGLLVFPDRSTLNQYLIKNKIKLMKDSDVKVEETSVE